MRIIFAGAFTREPALESALGAIALAKGRNLRCFLNDLRQAPTPNRPRPITILSTTTFRTTGSSAAPERLAADPAPHGY
jgi:hypothetical protein